MKYLVLLLMLAGTAQAAELTPILVSNGEAKMVCDGNFRKMYSTYIGGRQIVQTYLFGNLLTDSNRGADVTLWSEDFEGRDIQSQYASVGDLHIFSRPAGHTGGRQGEARMNFGADGVTVDNFLHILAVCWSSDGKGTLEIYSQIWVRDQP